MNHYLLPSIVLSLTTLLLTGCNTIPPSIQSGPYAEMSFDGLTKVNNTRFDDVWVRSDIDLRSYNKVMFRTTDISYKPVRTPTRFPLTEEQKTRLGRELTDSFVSELEKSYAFQIVDSSGPGVLLLKAGLQDVVSNVPPQSIGRTEIYLTEVGSATLVLELYDAESNTILARALDRQAVGQGRITESNSVYTWQEVRQVGNHWATITREGLEALLRGTAL